MNINEDNYRDFINDQWWFELSDKWRNAFNENYYYEGNNRRYSDIYEFIFL